MSLLDTTADTMSSGTSKPKKRVLVSYGVDIDAIAGWLGSYKGEDSTSDISRGTLKHDMHEHFEVDRKVKNVLGEPH